MLLQGKSTKEPQKSFGLKVKMGEYEVEIYGDREEVLRTIEELPSLITNVSRAFRNVGPKRVATLTVKTEAPKRGGINDQNYPKISPTEDCEENVIMVLQTDWGKWRPRTIDELRDSLEANGQNHAARVLTSALNGLVRKEVVRRWNTDAGFVYILAEKETAGTKRQAA